MAVFTQVSDREFSNWVHREFGFARVSPLVPITEGFQNTNYQFTADGRDYVFTIFEKLRPDQVRYYADFIHYLGRSPVPVSVPLRPQNATGEVWQGKPCLLAPFLPGCPQNAPAPTHCFKLGGAVAQLHLAGRDFAARPPPYDAAWLEKTRAKLFAQVSPAELPASQQRQLHTGVAQAQIFHSLPLPRGVSHADLHKGNVLWVAEEISGIIDFYSGGGIVLLFDLGLCVCNWCFDEAARGGRGDFCSARLRALLQGYQQHRELTQAELDNFGAAVLAVAVKFWLWRLRDRYLPRPAELLEPYDPAQYEMIFTRAQELGLGNWQIKL